MGGVAKAIGGAVKSVTKGVTKAVKGVASGVKKVASGIVRGIGKAVGGVVKIGNKLTGGLLGKLGPIGTIGMSLLLPGAGAFLGGLWKAGAAAASGYAGIGSTFINGIGTAMNLATKAVGVVSQGARTLTGGITSKIKAGFEYVGGKVADGANYLFRGAQEFAGVKNPSSIGDVGNWVVEKAQNLNPFKSTDPSKGLNGTLNTGSFTPESGWSGMSDQQIAGQFGEAGGFTQTGSGTINLSGIDEIPQGAIVGKKAYATNVAAGILPNGVLNQGGIDVTPRGIPYDPNAQFRYDIKPGSISGTYSPTLPTPAQIAARNKPSFFDAALRAGSTMLSNIGQQPGMMPQPYFAGSAGVGDDFASQRFGVGGQGSSGGDFLSEQQRQQQLLLAQQLAQLG